MSHDNLLLHSLQRSAPVGPQMGLYPLNINPALSSFRGPTEMSWFWLRLANSKLVLTTLCTVFCHQHGPPCHRGASIRPNKEITVTPACYIAGNAAPGKKLWAMEWLIGCIPKMLVYTNAFGGSTLSSKIISSKILDLPSLREQCSSACCPPQRGWNYQTQRN